MSIAKKSLEKKTAPAPAKVRGNMKPAEIKPLVITARKAFDYQADLGNVDSADTFDAWRRRQCMEAVGQPGITACSHGDFRPLLAHFQLLAGQADAAFDHLMQSGAATDHGQPGDTHEARRQLAHLILEALDAHIWLAEISPEKLLAEMQLPEIPADRAAYDLSALRKHYLQLLERKAAIDASGKGPVTAGYLVWIARQKTKRPTLNLGPDLKAGLAERLSVLQLTQLRDTLINRISAREGRGSSRTRNKRQSRVSRAKAGTDQSIDTTPRL